MSTDFPHETTNEDSDEPQMIICKMCGTENSLIGSECVRCGEPYSGTAPSEDNDIGDSDLLRKNPLGMWGMGNILVVHKEVRFPDICVKTNQPARGNRADWNVLMFAIPTTYPIGLTKEYQSKRNQKKVAGLIVFVVSLILSFVIPVSVSQSDELMLGLFVTFIVIAAVGIVSSSNYSQVVQLVHTTKECLFIEGVHQGFIDRFPEWEERE